MPDKATTILPPALLPGDTVAICSPAGAVDPALFDSAIKRIESEGYRVAETPHCRNRKGSYSGSRAERLTDMAEAIANPAVKAIICGRGGYGAVHLLDDLDKIITPENAKWIVGFSDISALHALMHHKGIASLHASMLRSLASANADTTEPDTLFAILRGERPVCTLPRHPLNRYGQAEGRLVGGNLSVLSALTGTPYNMLQPDTILFIEDINEPIYKIERMMYQLKYSGVLPSLRALIVGQFTGTKADANHIGPYEMIADMVAPYSFPVMFDAPIGHSGLNYPMIESISYRLADITLSPVR